MKRFFLFCFLFFLLTGCDGTETKTLDCSKVTEQDGKKVEIKLESIWKDDSFSNFKIETTYDLGTLSSEKKNTFKTYMDSTMSSWKEKEGVKYESSLENDKFSMILNIEASKGKTTLTDFGINPKKTTYESFQKVLEEDNYTCK